MILQMNCLLMICLQTVVWSQMVVVIIIRFVHMTKQTIQSDVLVKLVIRILARQPMLLALVRHAESNDKIFLSLTFTDSCQVNNGECDVNADCSHDAATFAVKCTCKIGFTNTSTSSSANGSCTGKFV